jgi:hypothetical protein
MTYIPRNAQRLAPLFQFLNFGTLEGNPLLTLLFQPAGDQVKNCDLIPRLQEVPLVKILNSPLQLIFPHLFGFKELGN